MNIIFIAVSLFFAPALLRAMDDQGENFYPVLHVAERGSLQHVDQAGQNQEVGVAAAAPVSSGQQIPKWITRSWFSKYLTKKNQQLLATHDFKSINNATNALSSRKDKAYTNLVTAWTQLKNRDEEKKDGAADSVLAQESVDPEIEHAYMKALLLELGAKEAKNCTDWDEDIKKNRKCRTRCNISTGLVAQLAWWGLYAAATAKTVGCWCFPWNITPGENRYLSPYCH